jgi:hypothetical protein
VRERFVEWQDGKFTEAALLGRHERMPTIWMIEGEFGGWRRACEEAIPGYVPPRRWHKRPTPGGGETTAKNDADADLHGDAEEESP